MQPNNPTIHSSFNQPTTQSPNLFVKLSIQLGRLTPRIAVAALAGFYVLGYAYANGWMMAIDQIAINIMRNHLEMGYIAIGAIMPTVQWYMAWGVRAVAALAAGLYYDLMERVLIISVSFFTPDNSYEKLTTPIILNPALMV